MRTLFAMLATFPTFAPPAHADGAGERLGTLTRNTVPSVTPSQTPN